jgi:hypothetical protein
MYVSEVVSAFGCSSSFWSGYVVNDFHLRSSHQNLCIRICEAQSGSRIQEHWTWYRSVPVYSPWSLGLSIVVPRLDVMWVFERSVGTGRYQIGSTGTGSACGNDDDCNLQ